MKINASAAIAVLAIMAFAAGLLAQTPVNIGNPAGDWPTAAADAQRTGWLRADPYISIETIKKGGFDLQWKTALGAGGSAPGAVVGSVATGGRKPITVVADDRNNVYAIDSDTGEIAWQRHFDSSVRGRGDCSAGGTRIARATALVPPVTPAPRGNGFGTPVRPPYRGAVGQPGEGAPAELLGRAATGGPAPAPPAATRGNDSAAPARAGGVAAPARGGARPGGAGGGAAGRGPAATYAVPYDGQLRVLGDGTGKDLQKPVPFLPVSANWPSNLVAVNNVVYAVTSIGCGDPTMGVWAIDTSNDARPVSSWKSAGNPYGPPAFGGDGTPYVATRANVSRDAPARSAITALAPLSLTPLRSYELAAGNFAANPVIVTHNGRELLAAPTDDGRVVLLDPSVLGGAGRTTALSVSGPFWTGPATADAKPLSSWRDPNGTTWLFWSVGARVAPTLHVPPTNGRITNGTVIALKIVDQNGVPTVQPGWTSADMVVPLPPIIINGVMFALASGGRASGPVPAVLYAVDPATGQTIWTSGKTIPVLVRSAAANIWSANSQILVPASDGVVYAFGFAMERH